MRSGSIFLPDKDSPQREVFQYQVAPFVEAVPRKSIPVRTSIGSRHRPNPCSGT